MRIDLNSHAVDSVRGYEMQPAYFAKQSLVRHEELSDGSGDPCGKNPDPPLR